MATFYGNVGSHYRLELTVNQTSQSIAANTSTLSWSLALRMLDGHWVYGFTPNELSFSATIDGANVSSGKKEYDFRNYSVLTLASGTKTVTHGTDGTKAVSLAASLTSVNNPTLGSGSLTGSMNMTAIPRATTVTGFTNFATNASGFTISVNKKHASYVHDIYLKLGTKQLQAVTSWTLETGSHTIPLQAAAVNAILAATPNSTTATVTVEVVTRSGSTVIGRSSRNATVTIDASIKPSITGAKATGTTKAGNVSKTSPAMAVKGIGTIAASASATPGTGAKIVSSRIVSPDGTFAGLSKTWTPTTTGSNFITFEVTDSRGRKATAQASTIVTDYYPAKVALKYLGRTRTANKAEIYAEIELSLTIAQLLIGGVTSNDYKVVITATPTDKSSATVTLVNQTYTNQGAPNIVRKYEPTATLNLYKSYAVVITVTDEYSVTTIKGTIGTASYPLVVGKDGIGAGKVPVAGRKLDVGGEIWDTVNGAERNISQTVLNNNVFGINRLRAQNTRNVDTPPNTGPWVQYEFKSNSTNGLYRGGNYNSVLTLQPWTDATGGVATQIGFTHSGISFRQATIGNASWGPWQVLTGYVDVTSKFTVNSAITDFKAYDDGQCVHIGFTYKPTAGGVGGSIVNTATFKPLTKVAVNVSPRFTVADMGKCSAFILETGGLHPVTILPINDIQVYSASYIYAK